MTEDIATLTKYNLWANEQIANWLLSNEAYKMEMPCESSYPSILSTVNHILEGQMFYFSFLRQTPIPKIENDTITGAIKSLLQQSNEFAAYTAGLSDKKINELRSVKFNSLSGNFSQAQLILHCMNHSTYHRGQLVTIGHQLELTKAPSTDLFYYLCLNRK